MRDNWSGEWISAVEKMENRNPDGPEYVNDEGIRYLIGSNENEWLHMHGDIPENCC